MAVPGEHGELFWTDAAHMQNVHGAGLSQSTLLDGRMLVCGGRDSFGNTLNSVEVYDPQSNTWMAAPSMLTARKHHKQSTLADGRVIVCGGTDAHTRLKSVEIFYPVTNAWTAGPPMLTVRSLHSQSTLADGRVLMCGGWNLASTILDTAEIFDPVANVWTAVAPMKTMRSVHSQSTLVDGRVLVSGGYNGSRRVNTCEIYDPSTNVWIAAAPMMTARSRHSQSTLGDGRVVVCGGCERGDTPTKSVEIFDPVTNKWTTAPSMKTARMHHSQSTLVDGRVLVCSGKSVEILSGDALGAAAPAPIFSVLRLPPVPSVESMLQAEKAVALREWLSTAEAIRSQELQRVEDARRKAETDRDDQVAKAYEWFERSMQESEAKLKEQLKMRVAHANAEYDRRFKKRRVETADEAERLVARVRRQAEEAEMLAAMLDGGAPPAAAGAARQRERPVEHFCSITTEVMRDPVVIGCGDTFERTAIEEWFKEHDTCPYCREPSDKVLLPNKAVKRMIQDW